jgi:hypothetical protein
MEEVNLISRQHRMLFEYKNIKIIIFIMIVFEQQFIYKRVKLISHEIRCLLLFFYPTDVRYFFHFHISQELFLSECKFE